MCVCVCTCACLCVCVYVCVCVCVCVCPVTYLWLHLGAMSSGPPEVCAHPTQTAPSGGLSWLHASGWSDGAGL